MSTSNHFYIIGAGLVGIVGAVSVFLYEHFKQERRTRAMAQNLSRLDAQISVMRAELEQMRTNQRSKRKDNLPLKRNSSLRSFGRSESDEYRSASDVDISDQEYFDISDEELSQDPFKKPLEVSLVDIDKKLSSDDTEILLETLIILDNLCAEYPNNANLWYRLAKCCHRATIRSVSLESKKENISKGIEACLKALDFETNNSEYHKLYAILIGLRSNLVPTKERIADGYIFKEHVDIAIKLNPLDASLHHMLGRFKYEIAGLKWFERKIATALFGEPPNATYDEALNCFLEAERLTSDDWKENKMYIGKCYIALGEIRKGVDWLEKAFNIVSGSQLEELNLNAEIDQLLNKYNVYR